MIQTIFLFLLFCFGDLLSYKVGFRYDYQYVMNSSLVAEYGDSKKTQQSSDFSCVASLICLSSDSAGFHFGLKVSQVQVIQRDNSENIVADSADVLSQQYAKEFLFTLSSHGTIEDVQAADDESEDVLNIKTGIIGAFLSIKEEDVLSDDDGGEKDSVKTSTLDNQGMYVSHWKKEKNQNEMQLSRHFTDRDFVHFKDENIDDKSLAIDTKEKKKIKEGIITAVEANSRVLFSGKDFKHRKRQEKLQSKRSHNGEEREEEVYMDETLEKADTTISSNVVVTINHMKTYKEAFILSKANTDSSSGRLKTVLHFRKEFYASRTPLRNTTSFSSSSLFGTSTQTHKADNLTANDDCPTGITNGECRKLTKAFSFGNCNFGASIKGTAQVGVNKGCHVASRDYVGSVYATADYTILDHTFSILDARAEYGFVDKKPKANGVFVDVFGNNVFSYTLPADQCIPKTHKFPNSLQLSPAFSYTYCVFGILPITFAAGLNLSLRAEFEYQYCPANLSAQARLAPGAEFTVFAEVSASIAIAKGGIRIAAASNVQATSAAAVNGLECTLMLNANVQIYNTQASLSVWYQALGRIIPRQDVVLWSYPFPNLDFELFRYSWGLSDTSTDSDEELVCATGENKTCTPSDVCVFNISGTSQCEVDACLHNTYDACPSLCVAAYSYSLNRDVCMPSNCIEFNEVACETSSDQIGTACRWGICEYAHRAGAGNGSGSGSGSDCCSPVRECRLFNETECPVVSGNKYGLECYLHNGKCLPTTLGLSIETSLGNEEFFFFPLLSSSAADYNRCLLLNEGDCLVDPSSLSCAWTADYHSLTFSYNASLAAMFANGGDGGNGLCYPLRPAQTCAELERVLGACPTTYPYFSPRCMALPTNPSICADTACNNTGTMSDFLNCPYDGKTMSRCFQSPNSTSCALFPNECEWGQCALAAPGVFQDCCNQKKTCPVFSEAVCETTAEFPCCLVNGKCVTDLCSPISDGPECEGNDACYWDDPWCRLRGCFKKDKGSGNDKTQGSKKAERAPWWMFLLIGIGAVMAIGAVVAVLVVIVRRKKGAKNDQKRIMQREEEDEMGDPLEEDTTTCPDTDSNTNARSRSGSSNASVYPSNRNAGTSARAGEGAGTGTDTGTNTASVASGRSVKAKGSLNKSNKSSHEKRTKKSINSKDARSLSPGPSSTHSSKVGSSKAGKDKEKKHRPRHKHAPKEGKV